MCKGLPVAPLLVSLSLLNPLGSSDQARSGMRSLHSFFIVLLPFKNSNAFFVFHRFLSFNLTKHILRSLILIFLGNHHSHQDPESRGHCVGLQLCSAEAFFIVLHCLTLFYIVYIILHCFTLLYIVLHCFLLFTLIYIVLHCGRLQLYSADTFFIVFHCFSLFYIVLHCLY